MDMGDPLWGWWPSPTTGNDGSLDPSTYIWWNEMISTSWTSLPLFAYIDSKMMKPSIAVVSEHFFWWSAFFLGGTGMGFLLSRFRFLGMPPFGKMRCNILNQVCRPPRCPKTHQWPNTTDYIISIHIFFGRGNEKTLHFETHLSFTIHCIQRDWFWNVGILGRVGTPLVLLLVRLGGWLLLILLLQRLNSRSMPWRTCSNWTSPITPKDLYNGWCTR